MILITVLDETKIKISVKHGKQKNVCANITSATHNKCSQLEVHYERLSAKSVNVQKYHEFELETNQMVDIWSKSKYQR
jgi:hypothetical protein